MVARGWLRRVLARVLWWRQVRFEVATIDETGRIGAVELRWSWRRWRWVRASGGAR